jgi:hypothetical protein
LKGRVALSKPDPEPPRVLQATIAGNDRDEKGPPLFASCSRREIGIEITPSDSATFSAVSLLLIARHFTRGMP